MSKRGQCYSHSKILTIPHEESEGKILKYTVQWNGVTHKKAFGLENNEISNGTKVIMVKKTHDSIEQIWLREPTLAGGFFKLKNKASGRFLTAGTTSDCSPISTISGSNPFSIVEGDRKFFRSPSIRIKVFLFLTAISINR